MKLRVAGSFLCLLLSEQTRHYCTRVNLSLVLLPQKSLGPGLPQCGQMSDKEAVVLERSVFMMSAISYQLSRTTAKRHTPALTGL